MSVPKVKSEFTGNLEEVAKIGLETVGLVKEVDAKVIALEQRIDRIVTAIGKAKSVKGL